MRVTNIDTSESAIATFESLYRRPNSEYRSDTLLFALNNGRYVLHQVCFAGDGHAHVIVHGTEVVEPVLPQ